MTTPAADVVILTALDEEHNAVVDAMGGGETQLWRGYSLHRAQIGNTDVIAFPINGMGNPSSAHAATLAISVWNPVAIILVGITGGMTQSAPDMRLGDILVPEQIVGYEQGKQRDQSFLQRLLKRPPERRFEGHRASWRLVQAARSLEEQDWGARISTPRPDGTNAVPRVFFEPVMSGEKVVASKEATAALRTSWPKAVGIEMEGLGAALAAYRGGPEFLLVKAVSDFADASKDDDWHPYAADAAAQLAVAVIERINYERQPERPQAQPIDNNHSFAGRRKLEFIKTIDDSWLDLADVYDVPRHERRRFNHGDEARGLWEWLDARGKLATLPTMLAEIGRVDVADRLRP